MKIFAGIIVGFLFGGLFVLLCDRPMGWRARSEDMRRESDEVFMLGAILSGIGAMLLALLVIWIAHRWFS